jgi:hypothetical protein
MAFGMVQEEKNLYRSAHVMLEDERRAIPFMDERIFELHHLSDGLGNNAFVFLQASLKKSARIHFPTCNISMESIKSAVHVGDI